MLVYIKLRDIAFCRSKKHHDGKYLCCFFFILRRKKHCKLWMKEKWISSNQLSAKYANFNPIPLDMSFSCGIKLLSLFPTLTLSLSVFYFSFISQFPVLGILKTLTHHRFMQITFNRFHFPVFKNAVKCLCKWLKFHRILSHSMNFCSVWITELSSVCLTCLQKTPRIESMFTAIVYFTI